MFEWVSRPLQGGIYKFAVEVASRTDNKSISEISQVTVIPAAKPFKQLGVFSFDKHTNQLVLKITDSV